MRFLGRSLIGVLMLSLTAGLFAVAALTVVQAVQERMADEPRGRPAQERVLAVNVVRVTPEDIVPVLEAFGEVQSTRSLMIRAAASGTVTEIGAGFIEGGTVRAGDLLVRIDPVEAEASLARSQADLADAEATLRDAERGLALARDEEAAAGDQARLRAQALDRQRDLLERGVGTAAAVEAAELSASAADQAVLARRQALAQAEARADQAELSIARSRIDLGEAQRLVDDTVITAPFDGIVSGATVVTGARISAGAELGELVDPTSLEVAARVSTAQFGELLDEDGALPRLPVRVRLDVGGIDVSAEGELDRTAAGGGTGQTGRLLFAQIGSAPSFRPGDFVTIAIDEQVLRGVARLPSSAVAADGTVLVLNDEERLQVAPTEILRRQGDDVLVSVRGLAGRDVVAERGPLLGAGIKVRPLRPGDVDAPVEPEMVMLTDARRARLVAFVEQNTRMPAEAKARVLGQLEQESVPAAMIARLEQRMGG